MDSVSKDRQLLPFPNGWYVVCKSEDLKPGKLISDLFCGKEIIIFRTKSGIPAATDAHCPHLGAHFGFGGSVEDESLKCPFHDFCFDVKGNCVKTGYGSKTPPKARLKTHHLREINGFILVWHDEKNSNPHWEIPEVSNEGWSEIKTANFPLKSHPQETTENSVDVGHFAIIHGYSDIKPLKELITDGPHLNASYSFTRPGILKGEKNKIQARIEIHAYGLGYSFVEVDVPKFGIKTRQYVFVKPTDGSMVNLKIGMSIKRIEHKWKINPLLSLLPSKLVNRLVLNASFKGYAHDVGQDFKIWENKIHINSPALAKGDGPIGKYRQWARQFYYTNENQ